MNKRGLSINVLVFIIIFAIVLIVMSVFSGMLVSNISKNSKIENCRVSISKASLLKNLDIMSKIDCSIIDYGELSYDMGNMGQSLDFDKLLAEQLSDCFYKTGEGKISFRKDTAIFGKTTACVICSQFIAGRDMEISNDEFREYLQTHSNRNKIVYYKYIWDSLLPIKDYIFEAYHQSGSTSTTTASCGAPVAKDVTPAYISSSNIFKKDKVYYTVAIVYLDKPFYAGLLSTPLKLVTGIGETVVNNVYITFVKSDDLKNIKCDRIVN